MARESGEIEFQVASIFAVAGRGCVFAGILRRGEIVRGQRIRLCSPTAMISTDVLGIEHIASRSMVSAAKAPAEIGVATPDLEMDLVSDGWFHDTDGILQPSALSLQNEPAKWWQFWR